jgi:hypothetical protein
MDDPVIACTRVCIGIIFIFAVIGVCLPSIVELIICWWEDHNDRHD